MDFQNHINEQKNLLDQCMNGDDRVERCLLCGEISYKNNLDIVQGEYVCAIDHGCDLDKEPGDNKDEMVINELARLDALSKKCKSALDNENIVEDFFETLSNIFKPTNQR